MVCPISGVNWGKKWQKYGTDDFPIRIASLLSMSSLTMGLTFPLIFQNLGDWGDTPKVLALSIGFFPLRILRTAFILPFASSSDFLTPIEEGETVLLPLWARP